MVVSASYVDTPLSDAPAGTITFTSHDIESRQATTVGEVLSLVPGVAVAANGGLGSVTSVFARGGESDFTLVMVDGVKLNSFGGGFDFGHLTTAGLSSLEVVRGPQSAVFGADAIGGVVQLRTATGGPAAAAVRFETGSLGTSRFVAATTGSAGDVGWGAHVERLASDGWTRAAPGTTVPVSNDDYDATNISLGASWKASRHTVVRVNSRFGSNDRGNPGPFGSNPIGAFTGIDTVSRGRNELALASVAVTHEWNSRTAARFHRPIEFSTPFCHRCGRLFSGYYSQSVSCRKNPDSNQSRPAKRK
jgi:outer membrane cobalamin receptor